MIEWWNALWLPGGSGGEYVASLATLAAVGVALWLGMAERRDRKQADRDRERAEQELGAERQRQVLDERLRSPRAFHVWIQPEPRDDGPWLAVWNGSLLPVRWVKVTIEVWVFDWDETGEMLRLGEWTTRIDNVIPTPLGAKLVSQEEDAQEAMDVDGFGVFERWQEVERVDDVFNFGVTSYEFEDVDGLRWRRRGGGTLHVLSEDGEWQDPRLPLRPRR